MRLLIDNSLSPRLAERLRGFGHDAVHVRDCGLSTAADTEIFSYAESDNRWIIAQDTDFGPTDLRSCRQRPSRH
jgi:predicted nuclease of predicted toxin-antitoxin system